ncbi:MAG: DUF1822 family protein [Prochlorotrichaceae cyanobacterium]
MNGQKTLADAFESIEALEQAWDEFMDEMEDDETIAQIWSDDFEPDFLENQHSIAIPSSVLDRLQKFLENQNNPQKAEVIKRSCLGTWALNTYLTQQGYPGDLENSQSWNPIIQQLIPARNLLIPNLGYLDCLILRSGETEIAIENFDEMVLATVVAELSEQDDSIRFIGLITQSWYQDNLIMEKRDKIERSTLSQPEFNFLQVLRLLKDSQCIANRLDSDQEDTQSDRLRENRLMVINTIVQFSRSKLERDQAIDLCRETFEKLYRESESPVEMNTFREASFSSDDDLYCYLDDFVRDCFLDLKADEE